jgi:heptosyltransferase-2
MVGDVVLGVPALKLLDAHGYDLHLYGKGWAPKLLEGHGWSCTVRAGSLKERIAQLRELRSRCLAQDPGFDQRVNMVVMPNSFSSVFEPWRAGLRVTGFPRDGRSLMLARKEKPNSKPHALDGFWQLACSFLGVDGVPPADIGLMVSAERLVQADAVLAVAGVAPGFVCIVPYAAGVVDKQEKKFPEFAGLTKQLLGIRRTVVTCPGPGGEEAIARNEHAGAVILPNLDLAVYKGVLKRASLVISNDTGPAHMAAALGVPVVSILGPTKPEQWAPWGSNVRVVQAPGRQWPQVDTVMAQVRALLV